MDHLLASRAIRDFQKLSEEAFQSLRSKYYRPADLVAGDEASTPVSG
jgi:hypothetical protein